MDVEEMLSLVRKVYGPRILHREAKDLTYRRDNPSLRVIRDSGGRKLVVEEYTQTSVKRVTQIWGEIDQRYVKEV